MSGSARDNNFNLMRMLAALAVLLSHSFPLALGPRAVEPFQASLGMTLGTLAVGIFFTISGYLVTASLVSRPSLADFALARARRIYPGLWVAIALTVFVLATHDDPRQRHYLNLYKLGEGPLYSFYTPYHLCHFEVPNSVARAVLLGDAVLAALPAVAAAAVIGAIFDGPEPRGQWRIATEAQRASETFQLGAEMAAMLITIFLGPKFIEYLRVKEFGQQIREEGPLGGFVVVSGRLAGLTTEVERGELPVSRQRPRQGEQRGRLATLPGCVEHEVVAAIDQPARLGEPFERRDHVVPRGLAGAGGVEAAHGASIARVPQTVLSGTAGGPESVPRKRRARQPRRRSGSGRASDASAGATRGRADRGDARRQGRPRRP